MILLSAQPDDFYYLWQLKLQLYNFQKIGINRESLHVLIGYSPSKGLNSDFKQFISENTQAQFFAYPDNRSSRNYIVSLRPHIIATHLKSHPELEKESIFFHDADIIFREIPDFEKLNQDDTWYASDTRSYLDSSYIKERGGVELLNRMCEIVGIAPETVELHDENAGGAQFLFKRSTAIFWQKIEKDCELMYELLLNYNRESGICIFNKEHKHIQDWCAEMWVLWWNTIVFKAPVKIVEELDFCWAISPIEYWTTCKILHYTGLVKKGQNEFFRKSDYMNSTPFYDDLSKVSADFCSYPLKLLIDNYLEEQNKLRPELLDITFLIITDRNNQHNILTCLKNLLKHFNTRIILVEIDEQTEINITDFPSEIAHFFIKGEFSNYIDLIFNSSLLSQVITPYISIYNPDFVLPLNSIIAAIDLLRQKKTELVIPFNRSFLQIDTVLKTIFKNILDPKLLTVNKNKLTPRVAVKDMEIYFIPTGLCKKTTNEPSSFYESLKNPKLSDITPDFIYGDIFRFSPV